MKNKKFHECEIAQSEILMKMRLDDINRKGAYSTRK